MALELEHADTETTPPDSARTGPAPVEVRGLTRRRVLASAAGVGALGLATSVLAGCGSSSTPSSTDDARSPDASSDDAGAIATTSQVPEGGGLILGAEKIVITQPAAGEFKAFTAVCTHMGCIVSSVSDNSIMCKCHGSTYNAATGAVTGGPAPKPLAPIGITVTGDEITRA